MRVEEIQLLVADVVLPPPDTTVSQWADENRRLSSESAAERGEWRTDRAPYQRAIMDALSPANPCEQVVLMSGAQLGKTSILENFIGYIIDHAAEGVDRVHRMAPIGREHAHATIERGSG